MGGKRRFLFKNWLLYCFVLYFVSLGLGLATPVFAQSSDKKSSSDDEFTLEEITVTAEKREAELQKIPMDIQVVRPDDMERMDVHQMSELDKMMPDLNTSDGGNGTGMLQLSIRGVDTDYWNSTAETTVAVFVDGSQLTRSNAMEGKFYDLERVEELKGPQGTLYGRGSTAGALSMVSKKPDIGEFGGNIQLEYGSFNRKRIEGALNIPATDKLAFRLAGRSVKTGAKDDVGLSVQNLWSMRASMKWEPTDRQSLNVTVDTDSTNNKGGMGFQGVYFKTFGDLQIVANDDPNLTEAFRKVASGGTVSTPYKAGWYLTQPTDDSKQRSDSHSVNVNYDQEFDWAWWSVQYSYRTSTTDLIWALNSAPSLRPVGATLNTTWFATDTVDPATGVITPSGTGPQDQGLGYVNYTSYSAYTPSRYPTDGIDQWGRPYSAGDIIPITELVLVPSTIINAIATQAHTDSKTAQAESKFTSKQTIANGDTYEWIAGAFWMDDQVINEAHIFENAYNNIRLNEYALYGQASYAPIDRINFTAGYRHVWDTKYYTGRSLGQLGYPGNGPDNDFWKRYPLPVPPDTWNHYAYKVNFDTYKFRLSWQATDDILPYIQYSKGMKTLNVDRTTGNAVPPEQLNSVDAGIKTRLFNGRLQLNLSAYYYQYKNKNTWVTTYQCRVRNYDSDGNFTGCKILGDSANAQVDDVHSVYGVLSPGGAKQHGGSAQITWLITPNDRFSLNAAYQHNELDNYNLANAMKAAFEPLWGVGNVDSALLPNNQIDRTGQEFGGRPWRGNFTYSHNWFIGTDLLTWTTTGFYEGDAIDQYVARDTASVHTYPGNAHYMTFDMSFNYSSSKWVPEGDRWSLRLFATNVFDNQALANSRYVDDYNQQWKFAPDSGYITGSFIPPRTLGVQVSLNF